MPNNVNSRRTARFFATAALLVGLASTFSAASQVRILGNEPDKEPMEYTSVAGFTKGLPARKDVEVLEMLKLEPGMLAYQTTKASLAASPNFESRTWIIFTEPHVMAPSVARLRTYVPPRELMDRRQAWATLCESTEVGCALLDAYMKRVLARDPR
ncbi:hypothetical protein [Stenotrophomonas sp. PS02289]|uniref:hypothetical protein n=1 Tax=Stenotrophomonas sp. PS02289 TaxID=2991422 RepID=UPI00249C3F1D|nr:hypothetical protein [Stenotrophomonas sp. PS02289]